MNDQITAIIRDIFAGEDPALIDRVLRASALAYSAGKIDALHEALTAGEAQIGSTEGLRQKMTETVKINEWPTGKPSDNLDAYYERIRKADEMGNENS